MDGTAATGVDREALNRDYLAAWNARDADRIASFFADDAVYDDRGTGVVARGPAEIRAHAARVHAAFEDLTFDVFRIANGDDFIAGEWRSRMTHTGEFERLAATGRVVESGGVDVATLDADGRITHLVSYYDGAQIMRDLGVLPARGSAPERALVGLASLATGLRRLLTRS